MQHLVNVSFAPVVLIMDDRANPLQLFATTRSFVFWLPAWLYAWLRAPGPGLREYARGWRDDLRLMAEAVRLLVAGRWVFLERIGV